MNLFIGIAAVLTLLVVAWLVYPLLRSTTSAGGVSSKRLNAAIHRDQLLALQADLQRGAISLQDFEASRDELQLRLLDDTESFDAPIAPHQSYFWSAKRTAVLIGLSTPVLALGLYLQLGTPAAINPAATALVNDQQIKQMVDTLAARLKANPDNPKGWAMLARSYKVMGRFDEARQAFENIGALLNTEPDLLVDYADVLAMLAGGDLQGRPMALVNQALAINPQHPMGLMMTGVAAYRRADYPQAIAHWQKLLPLLEPGSSDAQQIEADIAEARAKAGMLAPQTALLPAPARLNAAAGATGKLPPVPEAAAQGMTPEMINQMVERLAARLKDQPDNVTGWAQLARAYKVQGRTDEAVQAYAKTGKLQDTDPDLMTQYADLLATRAKGDFKGMPMTLITKALAINPQHPVALMMAGQAAYRAADYARAISHWESVLKVLPAGSPDADQVKAEIADAKARLAKK
ncbi:MAG: c-type cytochrome biogenesis protein CcmI [Rhodoferax sp.]